MQVSDPRSRDAKIMIPAIKLPQPRLLGALFQMDRPIPISWISRRIAAVLVIALGTFPLAGIAAENDDSSASQMIEVRTYILGEKGDEKAVDAYLQDALIPALIRQGIGPVGVFSPAESDSNDRASVVLVIPYDSNQQIVEVKKNLDSDKQFQRDAGSYLARGAGDAPFQRISSELLVGMKCMPRAVVPEGVLSNADRVYELRVYESPNERLGNLKVHMFDNGEVPIFYDSGIVPVFIGQCVIGPQAPNLTYLTTYPNEAARLKAWKVFRAHPDWQVLKKVKKYAGTVSKIDTFVLKAKPYSQM